MGILSPPLELKNIQLYTIGDRSFWRAAKRPNQHKGMVRDSSARPLKTYNFIPELPSHEPLPKKLSREEQTVIRQRQELQEYRRKLIDKEQQQSQEIETIASLFGLLSRWA